MFHIHYRLEAGNIEHHAAKSSARLTRIRRKHSATKDRQLLMSLHPLSVRFRKTAQPQRTSTRLLAPVEDGFHQWWQKSGHSPRVDATLAEMLDR